MTQTQTQIVPVAEATPPPAPAPVAPAAALFASPEPEAIVAQASAMATALARVIDSRGLAVAIHGRRHVRVEGWTLLGAMLGVFPVCIWSRPLADGGWEARVEARTLAGALVGAAEAQCTRDEEGWRDRPAFALRSMAQTRATSKALRLPLGFVMSLAGYDATPAEEMDGVWEAPVAAPAAGGGGGARPGTLAATEAQLKAVRAIARQAQVDEAGIEARCQELFGAPLAALSRRQASELIDALKAGAVAAATRGSGPG
jgi:hypothetical protein